MMLLIYDNNILSRLNIRFSAENNFITTDRHGITTFAEEINKTKLRVSGWLLAHLASRISVLGANNKHNYEWVL